MNPPSQQHHIFLGWLGALGALTLLAGDVLIFGHAGSAANFREGLVAAAGAASLDRLFWGGIVGPLGAAMCLAGFGHVWQNTANATSRLALTMFALLAWFAVSAGAFHLLCTASVLALKFCSAQVGPCAELLASIRSYGKVAYFSTLAPGALAFLLLAILTLLGKTRYPRWSVVANPLVLLLLSPLLSMVPSPVGAVLVAGTASLSLLIFFVASSLAARGPIAAAQPFHRGDVHKRASPTCGRPSCQTLGVS